jgi:hypothetical protein
VALGVVSPEFTVIQALNPQIDAGWVIVRHHSSNEVAEAYLDGISDLSLPYDELGYFTTTEGIFTLLHRPATPGKPDHLLVYVTKVPEEGEDDALVVNEHHVVLPDGTVAGIELMYF